jgi:hypothetical protein
MCASNVFKIDQFMPSMVEKKAKAKRRGSKSIRRQWQEEIAKANEEAKM